MACLRMQKSVCAGQMHVYAYFDLRAQACLETPAQKRSMHRK